MCSYEIDKLKIVESETFRKQFLGAIAYILLKFNDEFAANSLVDDYVDILASIKLTITSNTGIIRDRRLVKYGYRRKLLKSHKYAVVYRYEDGVIYLDYFFHQKQDYLNLMAEDYAT